MGFSNEQSEVLQGVASLFSCLSILGCGYVLIKIFLSAKDVRKNLSNRLVGILCALNALTAFWFMIGQGAQDNNGFCQTQAFFIQWLSISSVMWNGCMTYNLYKWIVKRKSQEKILRKLKYYVIASIAIPFVIAISLLADNAYGFASLWCWIDQRHEELRFSCFYLFIIIAWIYTIGTLLLMYKRLKDRVDSVVAMDDDGSASGSNVQSSSSSSSSPDSRDIFIRPPTIFSLDRQSDATNTTGYQRQDNYNQSTDASQSALYLFQRRLFLYALIFIVAWFFGLLNRTMQELSNGEPQFWSSMLHVIFVCSQGFLNAVVHGGLFDSPLTVTCLRLWGWLVSSVCFALNGVIVTKLDSADDADEKTGTFKSRKAFAEDAEHNPITSQLSDNASLLNRFTPQNIRDYSVFMTTLNLGECPVRNLGNLSKWIITGYDMYVIGVQECLELTELRSEISRLLGGEKHYIMYSNEIGSTQTQFGFHGYIALTIFVRADDAARGRVRQTEMATRDVRRGANLVIARASNKGGVGIPVQVFDVSLVFFTAHLASDSKGKSKIKSRNSDARNLLSEFVSVSDDVGFDSHLYHHHAFVLGDLNYRINHDPRAILSLVSAASSVELLRYGYETKWLQLRYSVKLSPPTSDSADPKRRKMTTKKKKKSTTEQAEPSMLGRMSTSVISAVSKITRSSSPSVESYETTSEQLNPLVHGIDTVPNLEARRGSLLAGIIKSDQPVEHQSPKSDSMNIDSEDSDTSQTSTIYSESSIRWSRLIDMDELTQHMKSGAVFSNFEEEVINFPPSYRRKKGKFGDCGDYTNHTQLLTAYTTNASLLSDEIDSLQSDVAISSYRQAKEAENSSKREKSSDGIANDDENSAEGLVGLRPPSYTDRVLRFSQPDHKARITPIGYDLCDDIIGSDHRPVSYCCKISVNTNISAVMRPAMINALSSYFRLSFSSLSVQFHSVSNSHESISQTSSEQRNSANVDTSNMLNIKLTPSMNEAKSSIEHLLPTSNKQVQSLSIVFPSPPEDPLSFHRQMNDFAQGLGINYESKIPKIKRFRSSISVSNSSSQTIPDDVLSSLKTVDWSDVTSGFAHITSCCIPEYGMHALFRLNDIDGSSICQTSICVSELLAPGHSSLTATRLELPLSNGGEFIGTLTGMFSLVQVYPDDA